MPFQKVNNYVLQIISFLCASLIPLLVTGPFLPAIVMSLVSLWFVYYTIKYKINYIYKNIYFYVFISFCVVCIFSSVFSDDFFFSLKSSLFYFRIGIFAILISYLIDQNKKILNYFYYSFLITFSILIIDVFFQYLTGKNLFGFPIINERISSFFEDELILGSYLSRLAPLFIALFVIRLKKSFLEQIYFFVIFFFIYVLVFLSGERASFFFINLSYFFIAVFLSAYKVIYRVIFFSVCIGSVLVILFFNTNYTNRFINSSIDNLETRDNYNKNLIKKNKIVFFSKEHDSLFRTAFNMFLDKPFLGHGPRMYRIKSHDEKYAEGISPNHPHPHNFYLQLLSETGIMGFLFLAGLLLYFFYLIVKHILIFLFHKKKLLSDFQICLLAGLLITIWPITTNGNFFTSHLMMIYSLQMGFFRRKI